MKTLSQQISDCIEKACTIQGRDYRSRIIVYPCGDVGIQVINTMLGVYGIEPAYQIDNHKALFSNRCYPLEKLGGRLQQLCYHFGINKPRYLPNS